ncbi:zinc finger protein CONSTANS-LIKE 5 [Silene latifolia]|uniref:zinc finger protein CONSTANS-LIKE 5 n=1 Tax=Silene latifolia TaxID=37657 RepID=UPI003D778045
MVARISGWGLPPRPCDICLTAAALLYCRADSTFLCGACDMKIHVTVHHERVWMCEVCEQSPAAVTCKADAAVLCTSCDNDIHSANPLASRHERVPVIPFLDSAVDAAVRSSTTTANSTFLIPTTETATATVTEKYDDEDAEAWLIPNPNSTVFYNESCLIDCNYGVQNVEKQYQQQSYDNQSFAFTDCIVPTKSEGNLSFANTANHFFDTTYIDFSQPTKQQIKNNKYNDDNNNQHQFFSSFNFSAQHSVSSSDIGVVPEGNTNLTSEILCNAVNSAGASDGNSPATGGVPAAGLDREARVLRYREKRKNRKFQKTIRYASRKAYAETRPRIKGRFAKRTGNLETSKVSQIMGSDFGLDQEYGVVPTF